MYFKAMNMVAEPEVEVHRNAAKRRVAGVTLHDQHIVGVAHFRAEGGAHRTTHEYQRRHM